jgi:hypothetical protein
VVIIKIAFAPSDSNCCVLFIASSTESSVLSVKTLFFAAKAQKEQLLGHGAIFSPTCAWTSDNPLLATSRFFHEADIIIADSSENSGT